MRNVVDMEQWIDERMTPQEEFVARRGADVQIFCDSSLKESNLSSLPIVEFRGLVNLMGAMDKAFGINFSDSILMIRYCKDKNNLYVMASAGMLRFIGFNNPGLKIGKWSSFSVGGMDAKVKIIDDLEFVDSE